MPNSVDEAIRFAAVAHEGMTRKGGNQPYIFHPLEVLSLVSLMTLDEDILCGAVLHDTVEDTGVTIDEIENVFGKRVARLVASETEDKKKGQDKSLTWKDRKQAAIDVLKNEKEIGAKMICLGDKVSNLRSFHLGLLQNGEEHWNIFHQKDPKEHYWYYASLRDAMSELKEYAVYKEYCFLIDTIFSKYVGE